MSGDETSLGPARRQGGRFLNPDGTPAGQPFSRVPRMLLDNRGGEPWPAHVENAPYPFRAPGPGEVLVTYVGHATFLIRTAELTLLTDPIWSDRASPLSWWGPKRVRAPGLAFDALPRVDVVLLSHAHYDHMDKRTLLALHHRDTPLILTGLLNDCTLAQWGIPGARGLDWGQSADLPRGGQATFLPARHFAARGPHDHSRTLWGGFAVALPGGFRLCFLGDTAWGLHLAAIGAASGPFDVALIPIGAYAPRWFMQAVHMIPEEAVQAHDALRAHRSLAMHHAVFRLTSEPLDEPAARLRTARGERDFGVPEVGETIRFAMPASCE